MTTEPASFGEILRRHRLAAGLSQPALAERAGLSVRAVSDLERGVRRAPYPNTIRQLARALGLNAAERARLAAAVPGRPGDAASGAGATPVASPAPSHPAPVQPPAWPTPLTRLIGRERELAEVEGLLGTVRLLTLTGAGGVGKTRLALAMAVGAATTRAVQWVDLAPLADPALVPAAVASAIGVRDDLGVRETAGRTLIDQVAAALAGQPRLLVLDNCEHLLDGCAPLAEALLRACPDLRILATSREPLAVPGETIWRVPSLTVPSPTEPVEQVAQAAAIELFVERAQSVQPGFRLTGQTAGPVVEICRRLDGLPLAIELAAARTLALPVEEIAARLDDCFHLLAGGSRTAPTRQQTLRATLDWSYTLLTDPERVVLRRLAVFAGSWSLAAAERVGSGQWAVGSEREAELPASHSVLSPQSSVLDLVVRLVAKSLVVVEPSMAGEARYRLLEPVRQYALERLVEAGEEAAARDQHRDWYVALAEAAEPALVSAEGRTWYPRLDAELDNLRAALAWCQATSPEAGVALAGAFWQYWFYRGLNREGQAWLTGLLAATSAVTAGRAKALIGAGWLAYYLGDPRTAHRLQETAVTISRSIGDTRCLAWALRDLAKVRMELGEVCAARPLLDEALKLIRQTTDRHGLRATLHFLGDVAALQGDFGQARAYFAEGLANADDQGALRFVAVAHHRLGYLAFNQGQIDEAEVHWRAARAAPASAQTGEVGFQILIGLSRAALRQGKVDEAAGLLQEVVEEARKIEWNAYQANTPYALGELACHQGDLHRARSWFHRSLVMWHEAQEIHGMVESLEALARIHARAGQPGRAARLLGATAARRAAMGTPAPPIDRPLIEAAVEAARTALGETVFAAAWAAGQALTIEQAVSEALAEPAPDPSTAAHPALAITARPQH